LKKLDLGQTLQLLGNAGVIIGILFLAYELNQNNRFLAEEMRAAALQNQISHPELIGTNSEVARLLYSSAVDQPLTELERYQRLNLTIALLRRWEWEYQRSLLGFLVLTPPEGYRGRFRELQLGPEWAEVKARFSPEFVAWMDEIVVNEH
jgi:hypothetical protein